MSETLGTKAETAKLKAAETRAELAATLDAIEDKLNVPKRVGALRDQAVDSYRRRPMPWIIAGVVAGVAGVGAIIWGVLRD